MRTIYHWHIDTASFAFDAYAETARDCRIAMQIAWARHREATGAEYTFDDIASNAPRRVALGSAWRDDFEIASRKDTAYERPKLQ